MRLAKSGLPRQLQSGQFSLADFRQQALAQPFLQAAKIRVHSVLPFPKLELAHPQISLNFLAMFIDGTDLQAAIP